MMQFLPESWGQSVRGFIGVFRSSMLHVARNVYFDGFIIAAIVANCLVLALADYENVDSNGDLKSVGSWRNLIISESEYVFTAIFTAECFIKITGMGIHGPNSYLQDRWNWLDLVVVVSGCVWILFCILSVNSI
jgi:hypothetical protein